jgi:hypothetical protein
MSTRLNWRFLLGEFFVIVRGVLVALWVDQIQAARSDAKLEGEYLESLRIDLDADLAQFDSTDVWLRKQEAAAATVLALYAGETPAVGLDDLVAAVETAGWQYVPVITRNTIDDLRSTGNLRLIRDPALRRSIAAYYTAIEVNSVPMADMQDRLWRQYDARVGQVLGPRERLRVLQGREGSARGSPRMPPHRRKSRTWTRWSLPSGRSQSSRLPPVRSRIVRFRSEPSSR